MCLKTTNSFWLTGMKSYLHRRISCLFYWFSVFKPFKVIPKSDILDNENSYSYLEHHNEFITYIISMMVLDCLNWKIDVHEYLSLFRQFLYDLHNRHLSRFALEFFYTTIYTKRRNNCKNSYNKPGFRAIPLFARLPGQTPLELGMTLSILVFMA